MMICNGWRLDDSFVFVFYSRNEIFSFFDKGVSFDFTASAACSALSRYCSGGKEPLRHDEYFR